MDEFEKSLQRDAESIRAEISPQLRARIDASLRGIEPLRPAGRTRAFTGKLWWASSLTGLAVAALVIVVLSRDRPHPHQQPGEAVAKMTVPPETDPLLSTPMLDIRTADFTSPLEEELVNLQTDIEKARESVEKDLHFAF